MAVGEQGRSTVPLLWERPALEGQPTAYPCRGFVCDLPVTRAEALGRFWAADARKVAAESLLEGVQQHPGRSSGPAPVVSGDDDRRAGVPLESDLAADTERAAVVHQHVAVTE